ncbi:MAG TPA: twin-arginine translocase TatA/TatE family subunit [Candidatus Binatia bacterium]|nr:twin-arginine translocase TatA/TatE family subunit [Candidatus Binatia bacterium]
MKHMSFSETIFLFFLALIIFGPKKLPEIARQVGKYLNEFKRASNEFKAQIEQEIAHLEVENTRQTILPPNRVVEGTTSRALNSASVADDKMEQSASATPDTSAMPAATAEDHVASSGNGATPPIATEAGPSTEVPSTEEVTSRTSQESHA